MRHQFCLPLRKRDSILILSTAALMLLTLTVSPVASGQQQESPPQSELGLEINLPDSMMPRLRLVGSRGGVGMTLIRRSSLKINDPNAAGAFTALDVRVEVEGDAIKVTFSLIYNDISNQEWWKDKKEKNAGSHLIHEGETAFSTGLSEFGIEPFEMKVIGATPTVFKRGEGPRIINNTTALEVEKLEKHLESYSLWLKNISSKDIVVYAISSGYGGFSTSGRGGSGVVLAGGATSREMRISSSEVDRSGITISLAIFTDGTFEGDSKSAATFLAAGEGVKVQAPHVLRMINQTLKVADSSLRSAFDKLEADLWVIPEALYKPEALQFLKTKFQGQDDSTISALYENFKGGLYDARNIALSDIGQTRRLVEELEQRGQFASAVESIRRALQRTRETLEKIHSSPR